MSKSKTPPRFSIGDLVRVKPGVSDPDFPDIPLGGWAGKIIEAQHGRPRMVLIRWNVETLKNVDPIFRKRSERDGLILEEMWLDEVELEPDSGGPIAIETPSHVQPKPLSPKDQEDRIRMALGLTGDDPLPEADAGTLATYQRYLAANLRFPFEAQYSFQPRAFETTTRSISVLGLLDPGDLPSDEHGLFCQARRDREVIELPLALVEVAKHCPFRQLLKDYAYWFVNWS